ncbi:MAG: PAS domain S-box protein [Nanoarchaeota archaeon]|nr:PAS domain S-box protein [Nanoarchaeota archaeon]
MNKIRYGGLNVTLVHNLKKKIQELNESEGKLNAMLQSIGDHMSMMDKDLNILWANEIAKKIFGNNIIGKKCYKVYHGRKKPCEPYPCLTLKAFQDGKIHEHNTQVISKDGKIIHFHCTANVALKDKTGKPRGVIEISRNVTEQKKAQEKLKESEEKYRALIETTDTSFVIIDGKGIVLDANQEYVHLTGHKTLDKIKGRCVTEWTAKHDLERNAQEVKKCFKKGFARNLEIDYVDKKGNFTPIEINATVLKTEKGIIVVTLCRDITKRKKAEQKLIQQKKEYQKDTKKLQKQFRVSLRDLKKSQRQIQQLQNQIKKLKKKK